MKKNPPASCVFSAIGFGPGCNPTFALGSGMAASNRLP